MSHRSLLATLALLLLSSEATLAQQSPTERALAASRRIAEYQELLTSQDNAVRAAGIEMALAEDSAPIRALAISAILRRYDALTIIVEAPEGARLMPADLPVVNINQIVWSQDGRSFRGNQSNQLAEGQLAGDRLAIAMTPFIAGRLLGAAQGQQSQGDRVRCQALLTLSASRTAMDGQLRCERMTQPLSASLIFGP